jgi:hypothetical protein
MSSCNGGNGAREEFEGAAAVNMTVSRRPFFPRCQGDGLEQESECVGGCCRSELASLRRCVACVAQDFFCWSRAFLPQSWHRRVAWKGAIYMSSISNKHFPNRYSLAFPPPEYSPTLHPAPSHPAHTTPLVPPINRKRLGSFGPAE